MSEERANAFADRLADVGYDVRVYQAPSGAWVIALTDNSGYQETCTLPQHCTEALAYMASEGELIAQGRPGRY